MSDFVRVKSKETGAEFSVRTPHPEKHVVLKDKRAVDASGRPLPAKPKTSVAKKAAEQKNTTPGAEPATTSQEGSA